MKARHECRVGFVKQSRNLEFPVVNRRAHGLLFTRPTHNKGAQVWTFLKVPKKRTVKPRALLAAVAGAAVVTFSNCDFTSGNLLAPPECGADAGPPGCIGSTSDTDAGEDGGFIGGDH